MERTASRPSKRSWSFRRTSSLRSVSQKKFTLSTPSVPVFCHISLVFTKKTSLQELREVKRRHESRVVELDTGHQQDFESKLAEALMEMRNQHDLQIKMYKEELEKTYTTKVDHQLL